MKPDSACPRVLACDSLALCIVLPVAIWDVQYTVMQKAHTAGFAVVGVWMFELAEAYCDGLTVCAALLSPFALYALP